MEYCNPKEVVAGFTLLNEALPIIPEQKITSQYYGYLNLTIIWH